MLKRNDILITNRGLIPANINCSSPQIAADFANFIAGLIDDGGVLPPNPPFEIHPYLNDFPLQNHEKYIIGTFPPISYVLDNPLMPLGINFLQQPPWAGGHNIQKPSIPFFHGNRGSMWDYLLSNVAPNFELNSLNGFLPLNRIGAKNYLINFLHQNQLNYSDVLYSIQRERNALNRYDAKDQHLNNLCVNYDLIFHLFFSHNSKYLLFNSASIFGELGLLFEDGILAIDHQRVKSFDLFLLACQGLGLEIEMQVPIGPNNFHWVPINLITIIQRKRKLIFELRFTKSRNASSKLTTMNERRVFTIVTGPSPSNINELGLNGNIICENWKGLNPGATNGDFIRFVYYAFRNNNWAALYALNQ